MNDEKPKIKMAKTSEKYFRFSNSSLLISQFILLILLQCETNLAANTYRNGDSAAQTVIPPLTLSTTTTTNNNNYKWNKEEFPNPQTNGKFCGYMRAESAGSSGTSGSSSLLCDPDKILTLEQARQLDHLMSQTTNTTKCFCKDCPYEGAHGVSVAIAIVGTIFRQYNEPPEGASQVFANYLRNKWQFGMCDNTVLILLIAQNLEITISMGVIAEKLFTEDFFRVLIMSHRAEFEQGNFFQGLSAIIGGVRTLIDSTQKSPAELHQTDPRIAGAAISGGNGDSGSANASSSSTTAYAIVGIIVGFIFLVSVLTGTIIFAKRRYEATAHARAIDPDIRPEGYFTGSGKKSDGDRPEDSGNDDDDDDGGDGREKRTMLAAVAPKYVGSNLTEIDEGDEEADEDSDADDNSDHHGDLSDPENPRIDSFDDDDDQDDDEDDLPPPPPPPVTLPPSEGSSPNTRRLTTTNGTFEYEPVSIEDDDQDEQQQQQQRRMPELAIASITNGPEVKRASFPPQNLKSSLPKLNGFSNGEHSGDDDDDKGRDNLRMKSKSSSQNSSPEIIRHETKL